MSQYVRKGMEESDPREKKKKRRIEMRENETPQGGKEEMSVGKKLAGEKGDAAAVHSKGGNEERIHRSPLAFFFFRADKHRAT